MVGIVGSVSRCSEFDGAFLPTRASTGPKWKRVDRVFHLVEELPPVTLYRIGDAYFVPDASHRVSVVRFHSVEWVDAGVTAFRVPSLKKQPRSPTPEGGLGKYV